MLNLSFQRYLCEFPSSFFDEDELFDPNDTQSNTFIPDTTDEEDYDLALFNEFENT